MAQKTHPNDLLLVKNIDENCVETTSDVVRTSRRLQDPESGRYYTEYYEKADEWTHRDGYKVKWDSHPHMLAPGEERIMLRYLAEHFAGQLATHMLGKMEKRTGRTGLIQSNLERPKMLRQIILRVQSYYLADGEEGQDISNIGNDIQAMNIGTIPPPAVGILKNEPLSPEEIMKNAGEEVVSAPQVPDHLLQLNKAAEDMKTSLFDTEKPLPLKKDLLKTAITLGLDINGTENSETLAEMIRKF